MNAKKQTGRTKLPYSQTLTMRHPLRFGLYLCLEPVAVGSESAG